MDYKELLKNPVIADNSTKIFNLLMEASKRPSVPKEPEAVKKASSKPSRQVKADKNTE